MLNRLITVSALAGALFLSPRDAQAQRPASKETIEVRLQRFE